MHVWDPGVLRFGGAGRGLPPHVTWCLGALCPQPHSLWPHRGHWDLLCVPAPCWTSLLSAVTAFCACAGNTSQCKVYSALQNSLLEELVPMHWCSRRKLGRTTCPGSLAPWLVGCRGQPQCWGHQWLHQAGCTSGCSKTDKHLVALRWAHIWLHWPVCEFWGRNCSWEGDRRLKEREK